MEESPAKRVGLGRAPRVSLILKVSAIAVLLLLIGFVIVSIPAKRSFPPVSVQDLVTAVQKYAQAKSAEGEPLPEWISAKDLVRGGFLSEGIRDEYAPAELLISTRTGASDPQEALVVAKYPNGDGICVMGDGSVQQFSPARKSNLGLKYP
jgi:hypothetical protein